MRFSFYSLRTVVVTHLTFLVLAAMLLINLVMIKFAERDLIQARLESGRLLLRSLEIQIGNVISKEHLSWMEMESDPELKREIMRLIGTSPFSRVMVLDKLGIRVLSNHPSPREERDALLLSRSALQTRAPEVEFYGRTWGVIWPAPERVIMTSPIRSGGALLGSVTVSADLRPVYRALRESEKVVLVYVFFNTLVLVLFGLYLLSRTVVRPVHKLLRTTEEFKEGEPLPHLMENSPNEIGQLSRSLSLMLKRLEENKRDLRDHITSLEAANEEIRKAHGEVVKSEKLASVGRLAAGVAHEIGNPIGVILGYLDLLKEEGLSEAEKSDVQRRIESEIMRINHIIRQLLDFSRPASGEPQAASVHRLITDTLEMLRPQPMMAQVAVVTALEATDDTVWADPDHLKQVFLNILMNAADAMAERGDDGEVSPPTLTVATANRNGAVELRIRDTGPGIPPDQLDRIFDPFFTTKEPGRGTGLGLSVSYKIVEELGGTIRADSTPGEGTTIIVDIPLHTVKDEQHREETQHRGAATSPDH